MTPKTAALTALLALLAGAPALAWTPALDETNAQAIVDDAYGRNTGPKVLTYSTVNLSVTDGAFAAGKDAVSVYTGAPTCLSAWTSKPTDYAAGGSRPASLTAYGQGDYAYWAAVAAHDNFQFMTAQDAMAEAKKSLPDGRIRVEVKIQGLTDQKLRDAYSVVVLAKDGKIIRPEKVNFLNDWKQDVSTQADTTGGAAGTTGGTAGSAGKQAPATWTGTMAYNFNVGDGQVDPTGTLAVLFRTEAKANCAFRVNLPLGTFR